MEYSGEIRNGDIFGKAASEKTRIRISLTKTRESAIVKKPVKPFSSSVIQDKKFPSSRKEIDKMNSKLELIKSKCMMNPVTLKRCDSRKTMQSQWLSNEGMNDSVDIDSEDEGNTQKTNKAYLLHSPFEDRPSTVFFHYPKCCGIESEENERLESI